MALSAAAHHSFDKVAAGEKNDGPRAQKTDRAGEAANKALRRQKSKAAGEAVFFELFDEETSEVRPEVLAEPRPQERVQRHTMEHIVDFVCCAPMVQILDAHVPQTVGQLQDVLQFFDRLTTVPEQVIEVPKIFTEDVPMRAVLRDTQLVEQLVEVPTIVSYSSLLLLQAIMEQNVDIPVVGGSGAGGGLSGFLPGQHYSMAAEQIVDNPVPRPGGAGGLQGLQCGQSSTAFSEQIAEFPDPGGGLQDFQPVQGSAASSSVSPGQAGDGFFRTFPHRKKVRRSRAPRGRNWVRSRAQLGSGAVRCDTEGSTNFMEHNMGCGVFSLLLRGESGAFW